MSACRFTYEPGVGVTPQVLVFWTGPGSPTAQLTKLIKAAGPPNSSPSPNVQSYGDAMFGAAGCGGKTAQDCIATALTPANRLATAAASSILEHVLPERAIDALITALGTGDGIAHLRGGGVQFDALGGAVADVAPDATAFPWRHAIADIQYSATWPNQFATDNPGRFDSYVHRQRAALLPYVGKSGYSNYADPSLRDYPSAYWGANLPRLRQLRRKYDPDGVFSFPQAVPR